jgi:hypothetical protein
MGARHEANHRPGDEAAMARVLAAEREALEAIERSGAEAQAILAEARARSRAIADAASRRIAAVRAAMEARLAARLAGLEALERQALAEGEPGPGERSRLERAIVRQAEELTGEGT